MHQPNAESRLSFMKAIVGRPPGQSPWPSAYCRRKMRTSVGRYGHLANADRERRQRHAMRIARQSAACRLVERMAGARRQQHSEAPASAGPLKPHALDPLNGSMRPVQRGENTSND